MDQPRLLLTCPTCKHTCRTQGETRPGAKFRCPGCRGMFYFSVHGNGFVELLPAGSEPVTESRLPPRLSGQVKTKGKRRIFASRRKNPIGGYHAFEKSRSYLGAFAFFTILGLGLVVGSWYISQIKTINNAKGRQGTDGINSDLVAKRKAFQEKRRRVMEKHKKQLANGQPSGAKAEDGPQAKPPTPN